MGTLSATSCNQGDLVTFLTAAQTLCNEYKTDFNATLTKLDSDAGVSGTNYNSLWALSDSALAIATQGGKGGITKDGIHQEALANFLSSLSTFCVNIKTNMAGLTAKLDLDAGVTQTDYAATYDLASTSTSVTKLIGTGISWGPDLWAFVQAVKTLLNEAKTNYNLLLAHLDSDVLVNDTNYAATNPVSATSLSYSV